MTQENFERLLTLLDPDRAAAGERYEALRHRLSDFFRYGMVEDPDSAADEVFDRAAAKLGEGVVIENVTSYLTAVARFVRQEKWNEEKRQAAALRKMPVPDEPVPVEREHACLDNCLGSWIDADRQFLLDYYQGDGSKRIAKRQQMAAAEKISLNALRNRALRLRARLEQCLHQCLSGNSGDGMANSRTVGKTG